MVLDADVSFWNLETTASKVFKFEFAVQFGKPRECNLSIPSKGSVEPAYGRSGPGNATPTGSLSGRPPGRQTLRTMKAPSHCQANSDSESESTQSSNLSVRDYGLAIELVRT